MINLAGPASDIKDYAVELELRLAGIVVVCAEELRRGEVQTRITGTLGAMTFMRAWYYWCVAGLVPETMARELYAHPVGRDQVRVAGHCGCPPPDRWLRLVTTDKGPVDCVGSYHIDTQEGLSLFVDLAKKHRLDTEPLVELREATAEGSPQ